MLSTNLVTSKK